MRMLVFHRGGQSGSLKSLLAQWRMRYPQLEIRNFDLYREVFGSGWRKLTYLPRAVIRGGPGVLRRGDGRFVDALNRSVWLGRKLTEAAQAIQRRERADLSFSFGSTYDAAFDGRPHFIYTDFTILANLYYPNGVPAFRRWLEWLPYERRALARARMVFTHSELASRSLVEQYVLPAERTQCVRCGSNVPPLVGADPQRFERRNVLFIGLDWERKGGPQLVEAFDDVRRRHPQASLTVVGCSPALRTPGVEVVGRVPLDHMGNYLGRASVFCMPSLREPFGYVYLEAMQAGLPVVASRRGPAPEFVREGENGFTVEPDNRRELVECLDHLLGDPALCRELGRRGRRIVETEYNWTRTCTDMTNAMCGALSVCP